MEGQPPPSRSEVDTTRPFRSVREAVAVFGERILAIDTNSQRHTSNPKPAPKPILSTASSPPSYSSSSSHFDRDGEEQAAMASSLKKLEAELEETRRELTTLKERGSETEIMVAELHKSMSRLADIEAAKKSGDEIEEMGSNRWGEEIGIDHGESGLKYLPSLAKVLSLGEMEGSFGPRRKVKVVKKKPIIPLIGDVFSKRKKKDSGDLHDSFYTPSFYSVIS